MSMYTVRRLTAGDSALAKELFVLMERVFGETPSPLSDIYVERLLRNDSFWAVAAFRGSELAGGVSAHVLPMTRSEETELFLYDIAVREDCQRQGVGTALIAWVRGQACAEGISTVFVLADNADTHAINFYRSCEAKDAPVTAFDL